MARTRTRGGDYVPARTLRGAMELQRPGSAPKQYEKGRICARIGCFTVLTRYNPDDFCYLHSHRPFVNRSNGKASSTTVYRGGNGTVKRRKRKMPWCAPVGTLIGEVGL